MDTLLWQPITPNIFTTISIRSTLFLTICLKIAPCITAIGFFHAHCSSIIMSKYALKVIVNLAVTFMVSYSYFFLGKWLQTQHNASPRYLHSLEAIWISWKLKNKKHRVIKNVLVHIFYEESWKNLDWSVSNVWNIHVCKFHPNLFKNKINNI